MATADAPHSQRRTSTAQLSGDYRLNTDQEALERVKKHPDGPSDRVGAPTVLGNLRLHRVRRSAAARGHGSRFLELASFLSLPRQGESLEVAVDIEFVMLYRNIIHRIRLMYRAAGDNAASGYGHEDVNSKVVDAPAVRGFSGLLPRRRAGRPRLPASPRSPSGLDLSLHGFHAFHRIQRPSHSPSRLSGEGAASSHPAPGRPAPHP